MPVILSDAENDVWLTGTADQALELLKPYPAHYMRVYPVSRQVNSPKNDAPMVTRHSSLEDVFDEAHRVQAQGVK